MKDKIFIVEDDTTIVKLLHDRLATEFRVQTTDNFRAVISEINDHQPDLVLMDITLPYFNGFYWTTEIRKVSQVPIIFISSATDEMNAVMAMNMGADDFVSKPFSVDVLIAKMNALLRRTKVQVSNLVFGRYTLDLTGHFSDGQTIITLTRTETVILKSLFEKVGIVVDKQTILKQLWESDAYIDANTLNVNMSRLRKKLLGLNFQAIHTVRGVGYVVK
ncbi:PhoB family transcriptional regulator [Lactococcus piscium]|jgi:DNA-binding response OmpR family regulator|uniref:PhoB family transcriptional regulator n=1 Tax=Pseudolactococcus piscium TaxID=1364 RepID=A0A2A5RVK0_9LACT|nr:response regulator transcription factor [Lactococcus piscium]MBR6895956.1 response regulator transcription factor [Lactococcus sp.]PCS05198.1 PhoB family transcriptional regulator [Lactococcus piscium]